MRRCRELAASAGADGLRQRRRGRAREQPRRDHRGEVHGRRVRHPDPLRAAEHRPRNLAAGERLRIPAGASEVLASYLKQNMRFFVAKVNLTEQTKLGFTYLRPLQMAFESPKFMLPLRLGMVNANGPQDLIVYALTRKGRVETTNYRTVKLPSDMDLPVFLKDRGSSRSSTRRCSRGSWRSRAARWCSPSMRGTCGGAIRARRTRCSGDELRQLGVFWQDGAGPARRTCSSRGCTSATTARTSPRTWCSRRPPTGRTSRALRPAARVVGRGDLRAAADYRAVGRDRQEQEAQRLASLTGWQLNGIRTKMGLGAADRPSRPRGGSESGRIDVESTVSARTRQTWSSHERCAAGDPAAWDRFVLEYPAGALSGGGRARSATAAPARSPIRSMPSCSAIRAGDGRRAPVAVPLLPGPEQSRDLASRRARAALRRSPAGGTAAGAADGRSRCAPAGPTATARFAARRRARPRAAADLALVARCWPRRPRCQPRDRLRLACVLRPGVDARGDRPPDCRSTKRPCPVSSRAPAARFAPTSSADAHARGRIRPAQSRRVFLRQWRPTPAR